jgi:serine protease inhibitor
MKPFHKSRWFFRSAAMIFLLGMFISPLFADEPVPVHSHPMIPAGPVQQPPYSNLASAQTRFGIQFFQEILKENPGKNLLVSPFSAATALGMVYNGAHGKTRDEMNQTLGFGSMEREEVNRENKDLMEALQGADPKVTLNIANSLWGNHHLKFKPDFLKANQDDYQAEVNILDFSKPGASDAVNQWVSDKTMGKIPQIIGPLTPLDKLVLVNAVYFKGNWASQFKKEATKPAPFHLTDGTSPDRPFMRQTHDYAYLDTGKFQAVRLPYGNGRLSLLVFLPSKDSSLADFCAGLTPDHWNQWMGQLRGRKVILSLPKFKIEFKQDLIPSLSAMGMEGAFDPASADFGDMAFFDRRLMNLYLSQALQKTYMLVDEEGTEAAAATAFVVHVLAVRREPPPVVMTVDRPFFIALVDGQTQALLFTGAVYNP